MKAELFRLGRGDRFILNNRKYTISHYKNKRMPGLGTTLNVVCFDEEGTTQMFIKNWTVEKLNNRS